MDYDFLKRRIYEVLGIDLNSYKEQQMRRRIDQWLTRYSLEDYAHLVERIKSDAEHREKFTNYLTINTSQFFRDLGVFNDIENMVLPRITAGGKRPRIWSAGASIGAEIYSIALLLKKYNQRAQQLLATDIDEAILDRAEKGRYSPNEVQNVPPVLIEKYFTNDENHLVLSEEVRTMVTFKKHDMLRDLFPKPFDLILCRNVFIYFTAETQERLIHKFVDSLVSGGFFIVGSAEHIMDPARFGLERQSYCIYSKL